MSATPEAWREACLAYAHRGHTIFYRHGGVDTRAPTALVLIHGFPTSSWDWAKLWGPLTAAFPRVIAPDMIGFGFSAKPRDYRYSILDQADLHENLLAHLHVKRYHILAHDYGDTVAQELLARHEDRRANMDSSLVVESCVFLNGGLFPEVHRARPIQKLLLTPLGPLLGLFMSEKKFAASFAEIFGAKTQPSPNELRDFWRLIQHGGGHRILHRLIRYIPERRQHRERWVGVLQKTKVPLRLINGPDDPVSGAHMVARYRELVPHADAVTLPGVGHYPQVEHAKGVLNEFFAFHDRLRSRKS